jgi:hypothetical protein
MTRAEQDVLDEREKQRRQWGNMHDDNHNDGALGDAAAAMLSQADSVYGPRWAAELRHKHRDDRRRQLVIGAAFALAELERFDRDREEWSKLGHKGGTP